MVKKYLVHKPTSLDYPIIVESTIGCKLSSELDAIYQDLVNMKYVGLVILVQRYLVSSNVKILYTEFAEKSDLEELSLYKKKLPNKKYPTLDLNLLNWH